MKKDYKKPEIEVITFLAEAVLCGSGRPGGGDTGNPGIIINNSAPTSNASRGILWSNEMDD